MELRSSPSAESFVSHSSQHPTPSGVKKQNDNQRQAVSLVSCCTFVWIIKKKKDNGITISKFSSFTSTSWRLSPPCFSVFLSPWKMASNDSQEIFLSSELWKKKTQQQKRHFQLHPVKQQDRQQDANWNSSHVFPSFLLLLSSFFNSQTCWWNCEVLGCLCKWVLSLRTFEVYVTLEVVGWKCTDAR